jgi:DcaP outer membrane protein
MQLRILGSVRFLAVYDNVDLKSKNSFSTFQIPTGAENINFPNYYNGLSQTRLGFEVTRKVEQGNLFVRLETDFAGVTGFRIRHAYGQYKNWLVGQTWSLFTQISVMPSTVDFGGPTSSISVRTPQIRYTFRNTTKSNFAVSLEYQIPDLNLPDSLNLRTFQLLPNLVGRSTRNFEWGSVQVSGIMPVLSARNEYSDLIIKLGWGVSLGALINSGKNGSWHFQIAGGKTISQFFGDLSGNDLNLIVNQNGEPVFPHEFGFYGTYQHEWSKKLLTNISYGQIQIENLKFIRDDTFIKGSTIRINSFWKAIEGAKLGIEGIWGKRTNKNNEKGNALRINALFYYDF